MSGFRGSRWPAKVVGAIVLVVCLAYFGTQLGETPAEVFAQLLHPAAIGGVVLAVPIYLFASLLLARGWWAVLGALGERRLPLRHAVSLYGMSQIGKYLPGNVFHLAGRQVLGSRAGVDSIALAASIVLEHLSLLLAAGSLVPLTDLWRGGAALAAVSTLTIWLGAPFLLASLGMAYGRRRCLAATEVRSSHWIQAWWSHLGFFVLSGCLIMLLQASLDGGRPAGFVDLLRIGAAFAPAWILGLVTPGAPSGVGVREAVLFFTLEPIVGNDQAVLLAITLRLVTSLGDLAFLALASIIVPRAESDIAGRNGIST